MAFRFLGSLLAFSLVVSLGLAQHQGEADHTHHAAASLPQTEAALQIPAALQAEHQELHEQLLEATKVGGETGKAAQKVADKLHAHFVAEEEFALPPLGVLQALAEGKVGAAGARQAIRH